MESLYLLVPVALVFLVIAIRVLFWAVNSGQYDDLDTEGHRILFDEPSDKSAPNKSTQNKSTQQTAANQQSAEGKETDEVNPSKDRTAD